MEKEVWKDIPGYEGIYKISNMGRLQSMDRFSIYLRKGRIFAEKKDKDGYTRFDLYKEGKCKIFKGHRLVASLFIDNPYGKPTVNHINGIKNDNRVCNLEWATLSEQQRHRYDVMKCKGPNTGRFGHMNKLSKPIFMISMVGLVIREFDSASSAARFLGGKQGLLSVAARGERKTYMGYLWKYK